MLTDDIRAFAQQIALAANAIDTSTPASSVPWPAPRDCLGGTSPGPITIPPGDGTPTGQQGEPAYSRRLANMPDGSIGVFGDSIIQATPENLMHRAAVNYALGGQSLRRMINDLHSFSFMRSAGAGVILCGVNDLSNTGYYGSRSTAAVTVISMFANQIAPWLTGKWVICHLLPCDEPTLGVFGYNSACAQVNAALVNAFANCQAQVEFVPVNPDFVDAAGNLKAAYRAADGQHLSKAGTALLAAGVAAALSRLGL